MMKSQGIYSKGGPIWRMEYDKENLETKESLNRYCWISILIISDQYIFDIILTSARGVVIGSRNNLIPFGGQYWQEIMRDVNQGGWVQGKMLVSGHLGLHAKKLRPKPEGNLLSGEASCMDGAHPFIQRTEHRMTPDHSGCWIAAFTYSTLVRIRASHQTL